MPPSRTNPADFPRTLALLASVDSDTTLSTLPAHPRPTNALMHPAMSLPREIPQAIMRSECRPEYAVLVPMYHAFVSRFPYRLLRAFKLTAAMVYDISCMKIRVIRNVKTIISVEGVDESHHSFIVLQHLTDSSVALARSSCILRAKRMVMRCASVSATCEAIKTHQRDREPVWFYRSHMHIDGYEGARVIRALLNNSRGIRHRGIRQTLTLTLTLTSVPPRTCA